MNSMLILLFLLLIGVSIYCANTINEYWENREKISRIIVTALICIVINAIITYLYLSMSLI